MQALTSPAEDKTLLWHELRSEQLASKARTSMLAFTRHMNPLYRINWHHRVICQYLDKFVKREITRLMIFVEPQCGKSELVSRHLPAFQFGLDPHHRWISASYNDTFASEFNGDVQKIIDSDKYRMVFPETRLAREGERGAVRNSERFDIVESTGRYYSIGIRGSGTGKTAHTFSIDDPLKDEKDAKSVVIREDIWRWFKTVARTRLKVNRFGHEAAILLTMCMTGDTPVLMADGTERRLDGVKVGDAIATYDGGKITTSRVIGWKNQGPDLVFKVRTSFGITVKANKRHPFLVSRNGELKWIRLKNLEVGDHLVRASTGASGLVCPALSMDARSRLNAEGTVTPTTTKQDGQVDIGRHQLTTKTEERFDCEEGTASRRINIRGSLKSRTESVQSADCHRPKIMFESTGEINSALTTTTTPEKREDCCVTTATWPSGMEKQNKFSSQPLSTYGVTLDSIAEISEVGREDVFDIQVERTENFIANGLVSHNTRWHHDDLAARLIEEAKKNPGVTPWTILCFPAIKENDNDPLDPRKVGEALWVQNRSLAQYRELQADPTTWNALFMQRPSTAEGTVFKRGWWRYWQVLPEKFDKMIQSWDLTFDETDKGSFVVGQVWGKLGPNFYLVHQFRERIGFTDQIDAFLKVTKDYPHTRSKLVEKKANGAALINMLRKKVSGIDPIEPDGSKENRAEAVAPLVKAGNVYIPDPKLFSWVTDFLDEHSEFPKSKFNDQVDGTSQALTSLDNAVPTDFNIGSITGKSKWG